MARIGDVERIYDHIHKDATFKHLRPGRLVEGEGDSDYPRAFIVGDAPTAYDSTLGRPFVSTAGLVLRQLMEIADLHAYFKQGVYYAPNCWLTTVSKYRSPVITWEEVQVWRRYLRREWVCVGMPSLIIPVGSVALSTIMGDRSRTIFKSAGFPISRPSKYHDVRLTIWPMINPSYGMRHHDIRPSMEMHWKGLGEWLDNHKRQAPRR